MFRKLLHPTDFSECSTKAFEYVKALCNQNIAKEVVLLHVVNKKKVEDMAMGVAWFGETALEFEEEFKYRLLNEAKEKLEELSKEIKTCNVKVVVSYGSPVKEILRVADEEKVSLIVVGSHGRSNFEEILLGSVSEGVIRKAEVPVLVVRRKIK